MRFPLAPGGRAPCIIRRMPNDANPLQDAVDRFVRSLGPGAIIRADDTPPGVELVGLRRGEVCVDSGVPGREPVRFLVGCRDKPGKSNVDDIRAFKGEIESAGASAGVLYSLEGFTAPAVAMARASGIACCRMFADRPAESPHIVNVVALHARPEIRIDLQHIETLNPPPATWGELFDYPIHQPAGGMRSVLDAIGEAFAGAEAASVEARGQQGLAFPPDVTGTIEFSGCRAQVHVTVHWRRFRGPVQSHLVNGSRLQSDELAAVQHMSPTMSVSDAAPGVKWEEIPEGHPLPLSGRQVLLLMTGSNPRPALVEQLARKPLPTRANLQQPSLA